MSSPETQRLSAAGILSATSLLLTSAFAGALGGGLFVRLFVPKTGMGWDQLADMLGGLMLGALIGLTTGALLSWSLPAPRRWLATGGMVLLTGLLLLGLRLAA